MPAGTIEVFLIGAVGIKDTELFGKADPYASLVCGKQKLRSNTASNQGSKPLWNQKFSFYIDDNTNELQITVYNRNILKEDDEIGTTIIPLAKVFAEGKLPTTSYNVIRPSGRVQGEIKLSISFIPKNKPGQQNTGQQTTPTISGPYGSKLHGSPYATPPPEPKVKHDPLMGPHGYFKNNSSAAVDSSVNSTSHGSKPQSYSSVELCFSDDSTHGSSRPYPSPATSAYPSTVYPPVSTVNESDRPYHHTDSNTPYGRSDGPSGQRYSAQQPSYPHLTSFDYGGSVYQHSPYGNAQPPPAPLLSSEESHHGAVPVSSTSSGYPPQSVQNTSCSSVPSGKPSHGGMNQYNQFNDLAGNFAGLNVSGEESSSHGGYPGYYRPNNNPAAGYPPTDSSSHGNYPGYIPPPNVSTARPPSGYPPSGYPPPGYPSQSDGSSHGNFSHPGPYSPYGYQSPLPPPFPLPMGFPPPSADAYPPVPYYNAPPPHYMPAGYPK